MANNIDLNIELKKLESGKLSYSDFLNQQKDKLVTRVTDAFENEIEHFEILERTSDLTIIKHFQTLATYIDEIHETLFVFETLIGTA